MTIMSFLGSRPLKLGFLCPHNPYDKRSFSGTAYFAAQALGNIDGVELLVLGSHGQKPLLRRPETPITVDKIDFSGLDAVLGLVASPLLDRMAQQRPNLSFIHVTDATPRLLA